MSTKETPKSTCCAGGCIKSFQVPYILTWKDPQKTGLLLGQLLGALIVFSSTFTLRLFLRLAYTSIGLLSLVEYASRKFQGSQTGIVMNYRPSRFLRINEKSASNCVASAVRCLSGGIEHLVDAQSPCAGIRFSVASYVAYKLLGVFSFRTLSITAIVLAFTVPRIYLEFQEPIDRALGQICHEACNALAKAKDMLYEKAGPQIDMLHKLVGGRGGFPSNNGEGVAPRSDVPGSAAASTGANTSTSASTTTQRAFVPEEIQKFDSVPTMVGDVKLDTAEAKEFAAAAASVGDEFRESFEKAMDQ